MTGLQLLQQIAGALTAAVPVLAAAVWERRARQTPGRHRPETVTPLRLVPEPAAAPYGVIEVDWSRSIDDWTADLPTEAFPPLLTLHVGDAEIDAAVAAADFTTERIHTSPTETAAETARRRWGVECPIFAGLAKDRGYDPIRGFEAFDTARAVA
jgi:hypothetical protein